MTVKRIGKPRIAPDKEFDRRQRNDPVMAILVETLFQHENRLRNLEGRSPRTMAQFRADLKKTV
jgi:hypothetical protein